MALLEKKLIVKKSTVPGAGKGLFTKVFIPKGTRIVEYKGQIVTWKEIEKMADDRNGYVFFFNNKHCIICTDTWCRWKARREFSKYEHWSFLWSNTRRWY